MHPTVLCVLTHLIFNIALTQYCYYPHYTKEETEAWKLEYLASVSCSLVTDEFPVIWPLLPPFITYASEETLHNLTFLLSQFMHLLFLWN